MRARLTLLCAGLVLVAACQTQAPTPVKKATASARPGPADPVVAGASSTPGPEASVAALAPASPGVPGASPTAAVVTAPDKLRPGPGATSVLKGVARLDGAYIVAQGAGNIISGNGSAVISGNGSAIVAAGGGNIISGNGSAAIANASGQIVAQGGGNIISGNGSAVISGNGSAIVAQGGGNIVAQGGGNIVAQGGGNIVAQGGGNIVAQGAGNRRLLEAGADDRTAVAGMPLGVYSLTDHQPVPIGVDKDGKQVYTAYTNQDGGFELWLPKEQEGNVLVVAHVQPDNPDPRLHYGLVTRTGTGADVSLDEDTAALTTYLRRGLGPFLAQGMLEPDTEKVVARFLGTQAIPCVVKNVMIAQYTELRAAAAKAGIDDAPAEEVQDLVQRMVDMMTRDMYLGADPNLGDVIMQQPSESGNDWQGPAEPAMGAMLEILRLARQAAREKVKLPGFFDDQKFLQQVNAMRRSEGLPAYKIQKDSDLINMIVTEYFAETDPQRWLIKGACKDGTGYLFGMLGWIFDTLGMQNVTEVGLPDHRIKYHSDRFGQSDRADQSYYAILTRGFLMLASATPDANGKTTHDKVYGLLTDFKPSGKPRTSPTPVAYNGLPCPPNSPSPTPSKAPKPCK
ncbi:MAG: hypothetical protein JWM80_4289 [Cyanobacteria bacterium RYN_339]|nr:hypothetical protein [Cyanobacteria bacterium RYN_339]